MLQLVIQVTVKRSGFIPVNHKHVKIKFQKTTHRKKLSEKEIYDKDL